MTAAVTGGIDSNGMCPGDPSSYYERNGAYEMLPPGTDQFLSITIRMLQRQPWSAQ